MEIGEFEYCNELHKIRLLLHYPEHARFHSADFHYISDNTPINGIGYRVISVDSRELSPREVAVQVRILFAVYIQRCPYLRAAHSPIFST